MASSRVPELQHFFQSFLTDIQASGGNNNIQYGNLNLDFIETTAFEAGITHLISDNLVLDVVGYNRDRRGAIRLDVFQARSIDPQLDERRVFVNGDNGNVKGFDITLNKRYSDYWSTNLAWSLQWARGTTSSPIDWATGAGFGRLFDPLEGQGVLLTPPTQLQPEDFDRLHNINWQLTLQFPEDFREGTTLGTVFKNSGAFLNYNAQSGTPFTRRALGGQQFPVEDFGASRLPWFHSGDIRLQKGFDVGGVDLSVFGLVRPWTCPKRRRFKNSSTRIAPTPHAFPMPSAASIRCWMTTRCISAITPNASCAGAAFRYAPTMRRTPTRSASKGAVSTPASPPSLTSRCLKPPAYFAASASASVPPARSSPSASHCSSRAFRWMKSCRRPEVGRNAGGSHHDYTGSHRPDHLPLLRRRVQSGTATKDDFVYKVTSPFDAVVNHGNLCVKGRFGYDFVYNKDRITTPLIRKTAQEPGRRTQAFDREQWREVSWDEALDYAAGRLVQIYRCDGAEAMAVYCCAKATNEDNYLLQKLFRALFRSNNVDHCTRLCHAGSVVRDPGDEVAASAVAVVVTSVSVPGSRVPLPLASRYSVRFTLLSRPRWRRAPGRSRCPSRRGRRRSPSSRLPVAEVGLGVVLAGEEVEGGLRSFAKPTGNDW